MCENNINAHTISLLYIEIYISKGLTFTYLSCISNVNSDIFTKYCLCTAYSLHIFIININDIENKHTNLANWDLSYYANLDHARVAIREPDGISVST